MKKIFVIVFLNISIFAYCQIKIGYTLDSDTNESIPYTNIIGVNNELKLISDKNGTYSIESFENLKHNDKIIFYAAGYDSKELLVSDIVKSEYKVFLDQKSILLEEAIISPNVQKEILGNKELGTISSKFFSEFDPRDFDKLGKERGIVLTITEKTKFNNLKFYVVQNEFKYVKLKLNFYSVLEDKTLELLNQEDIFIEVKDEFKGWVDVDLDEYNLIFNKQEGATKIIAALQWLESIKTSDESEKFGINTKRAKKRNRAYNFNNQYGLGWKFSKYDLAFYFDVTVFK